MLKTEKPNPRIYYRLAGISEQVVPAGKRNAGDTYFQLLFENARDVKDGRIHKVNVFIENDLEDKMEQFRQLVIDWESKDPAKRRAIAAMEGMSPVFEIVTVEVPPYRTRDDNGDFHDESVINRSIDVKIELIKNEDPDTRKEFPYYYAENARKKALQIIARNHEWVVDGEVENSAQDAPEAVAESTEFSDDEMELIEVMLMQGKSAEDIRKIIPNYEE